MMVDQMRQTTRSGLVVFEHPTAAARRVIKALDNGAVLPGQMGTPSETADALRCVLERALTPAPTPLSINLDCEVAAALAIARNELATANARLQEANAVIAKQGSVYDKDVINLILPGESVKMALMRVSAELKAANEANIRANQLIVKHQGGARSARLYLDDIFR